MPMSLYATTSEPARRERAQPEPVACDRVVLPGDPAAGVPDLGVTVQIALRGIQAHPTGQGRQPRVEWLGRTVDPLCELVAHRPFGGGGLHPA